MDPNLRHSMLDYYNERAPEYEEVYTLGKGSASIPDPNVFKSEAASLGRIVERFAHGRMIDIACGTAYWLPYYASHCSNITFFDQSEKMLGECKKKVDILGIVEKSIVLRGDFFDLDFGHGAYDCALIGFFWSHLTELHEQILFNTLKNMLGSSGRFLILDSAWSDQRAQFNEKVEHQERRLNDGRTFEIYKRYCNRDDITRWAKRYDVTVCIEHFETAYCAVSGSYSGKSASSSR